MSRFAAFAYKLANLAVASTRAGIDSPLPPAPTIAQVSRAFPKWLITDDGVVA